MSAALMFITMLFYKLGKKEHLEIIEKLKELGLKQGNEQVEAEAVGISEISKQIEETEGFEGDVNPDETVAEEKSEESDKKDGSDGENTNDIKF